MLKCLLSAVKHLNSNDSYHGDICPDFIYIDTQGNGYSGVGYRREPLFKIFDSAYFKPICNGKFLSIVGYYRAQKEKVYCAPEILHNLGEQRVFPLYNYNTADTFSVGLVVLYCMTLIDPLGAYSITNHQIDFYYIESMLRIAVRKGYSQDMITVVR